jgi:hypothetical protein
MTVRQNGGKTGHLNRGFVRYVSCNSQDPRYCPVQLTLDYLAFLSPGYSGYLVARSQTAPNRKLCLDGLHRLSYANALRDFRFLLQALGYDPKEYAEHSPKRGLLLLPPRPALMRQLWVALLAGQHAPCRPFTLTGPLPATWLCLTSCSNNFWVLKTRSLL